MKIVKKDGSTIELIRYFEFQGKKILIFSNDQLVDEEGHAIIHICSINNTIATAVATDDMDIARNAIKNIVKENRNNLPLSIIDLDYNDLNGVEILSDWPLKMMPNYIEIMKENQPTFDTNLNFFDTNNSNFKNDTDEEQLSSLENLKTLDESNNNFKLENQELDKDENNHNFENYNFSFQPLNSEFNISKDDNKDYEKLYFEQLDVINKLNSEIDIYKSKIEQIKELIEK